MTMNDTHRIKIATTWCEVFGRNWFLARAHGQAKPYLYALHLSDQGGPAPVFKEEPVAPLW